MRATTLTMSDEPGCSSISAPATCVLIRSAARAATARVSPSGFGDGVAIKGSARSITCSTLSRETARRPASTSRKARLPDTDRVRQRPADDEIDQPDEREYLQRPEGRGRQLHAPPRHLAHGYDGRQRGIFDELDEVCRRRQHAANGLWTDDSDEALQRGQAQYLRGLAMPRRNRRNPGPESLGNENSR